MVAIFKSVVVDTKPKRSVISRQVGDPALDFISGTGHHFILLQSFVFIQLGVSSHRESLTVMSKASKLDCTEVVEICCKALAAACIPKSDKAQSFSLQTKCVPAAALRLQGVLSIP